VRGMSAESRYLRFFTSRVDEADVAARLAAAEARGGVGVVAEDEHGRIVGHAHLSSLEDSPPEMAVAVADDLRGQGLGPNLLEVLGAVAEVRGAHSYRARVLMSNQAMLKALRRIGCAVMERHPGVVEVLVATRGGMPGWPSGEHDRPRVLVEGTSLFGSLEDELLRGGGYEAMFCPGAPRGSPCALVATGRCPLAAGADLIVCGFPLDATHEPILAAHRRSHPRIPVCLEVKSVATVPADLPGGVVPVPSPSRPGLFVEAVERALGRQGAEAEREHPGRGSSEGHPGIVDS